MTKVEQADIFRLRKSSVMNIADLLNQSPLPTLGTFDLQFTELHNEHSHFVSFCPIEGQNKLFAVAAGTSLHIYRLELSNLEHNSGTVSHEYVCRFDFTSGRPLSDLAWSPWTRVDQRVELMVALSCGTICLCKWIPDPINPAGNQTTIERLAKHEGGGVCLHVSPRMDIGRAASAGADNVLRLYDIHNSWDVIEKKVLQFAGLHLKFIDNEIVLVEMGGTIRMYDARTVYPIRVALYQARLCQRIACPDEELIVMVRTGVLQVLDVPIRTGPRLTFQAAHNQENKSKICICVAASTTRPWVAHADAGGCYVQSTETGEVIQRFPSRQNVHHLCWHPDITLLAVSCGSLIQFYYLR